MVTVATTLGRILFCHPSNMTLEFRTTRPSSLPVPEGDPIPVGSWTETPIIFNPEVVGAALNCYHENRDVGIARRSRLGFIFTIDVDRDVVVDGLLSRDAYGNGSRDFGTIGSIPWPINVPLYLCWFCLLCIRVSLLLLDSSI